jgi:hypothetical protein
MSNQNVDQIKQVRITNISQLLSNLYTTAGIQLNSPKVLLGTATIGGGGTVVVNLTNIAFTSTTSYVVLCENTTAARLPEVTHNSNIQFTLTGTAADVINFIIVGN